MFDFVGLHEQAKEKLQALHPAFLRLRDQGIQKQMLIGDRDSQTVVTYPPSHKQHAVVETDVYSNPLHLRKRNTLYLHVPFCDKICQYCAYQRTAKGPEDPRIDHYVDLVQKETQLLASANHKEKIQVESIYIGGGTPTILSEQNLEKLLQMLDKHFELVAGGEFSLEGSPATITEGKVRQAMQYGVNRISIGVEAFDDHMLKVMGREVDNRERVFAALAAIRSAGISNIDIDLIRGFTGFYRNQIVRQTPQDVVTDLLGIQELEIPSVTSYQHIVKPKSLGYKKRQKFNFIPEEKLLLHMMFNMGMEQMGYQQHPIDFHHKTQEHVYKHQVYKWGDMTNQIALGPSAYGYLNDTQFTNHFGADYEAAIQQGKLPVASQLKLSKEEVMRRKFVFGMKTGVSRAEFEQHYGINPLETSARDTLHTLEEAGGLEITPSHIRLTEVGRLFADWIQMCFYSDAHQRTPQDTPPPLSN